jgi:glycosyltransferase involved in cell wall biosynthesis
LDDGVRVYRIQGTAQRLRSLFSDASRPYAPPLPDPEAVIGLRHVLAQEQPDVIHGHNWLVYSYLPLTRASRSKLVLSIHDYASVCAKKTLILPSQAACNGPRLGKCLRCASQHYGVVKATPTVLGLRLMNAIGRASANAFAPVSRAVVERSRLSAVHVPIEVIPPFIADDLEDQIDVHAECLADLPGEPFLLFVGQLGQHKGVRVLLEAYAGLADGPPLVLIGLRKPDTPNRLPPNVHMLHDWPHGAVLEAWRRSMIGLVPSIWPEPFGIVSLEAMALGRPLIGSRTGGIVDCVADGLTGLLVPPGDPVALRGAIVRLLDNAALREDLGRAAREHAASFRASAVVPRVEALYRHVLATSG